MSARSHERPSGAHWATARAVRASTTCFMVTSMPSEASEVTGLSAMPHGTMWPNIAMSGATLRAKPCIDRPRVRRTPMAAILRGWSDSGATHTPG